mgnify:CR=1 FL=1
MRRKRFLLIGLVAAVVVTAVVAFLRWSMKVVRVRLAQDLVHIAGNFMNESRPFDPMVNLERGIPPALFTREHAAIYCLLKALELDDGKHSAANYFLANYLLDKNCAVALYYLEEHCRLYICHEELLSEIENIRREGCDRFHRPTESVEDAGEGADQSPASAPEGGTN